MSYLIHLNSTNIIFNGFNNQLEHVFPGTSASFTDTEVAIHSINMYNSVFNIDSSQYGNNTISIIMPTASSTSSVSIVFDDGLYSYADMTRFIQRKLEAAGAYLIDADGNFRHYFQITENSVYYSAQVDLSPVPTSLPSGWSRPASGLYSSVGSGLPTTTRVPILSISNTAFGSLIGFQIGSFPSSDQTTAQTFLGSIAPTINPVSSFIVRCNLIDNPYAVPSDILSMFDSKSTQAGQMISYTPNEYSWIPIKDGSYASIRLTIIDQLERFVKIRDPNISIVLAFRPRR